MENVVNHIQENRNKYVEELKDILTIASVSTANEHKADVLDCAKYLENELNHIGLENVRLYETPGNPIIYGD